MKTSLICLPTRCAHSPLERAKGKREKGFGDRKYVTFCLLPDSFEITVRKKSCNRLHETKRGFPSFKEKRHEARIIKKSENDNLEFYERLCPKKPSPRFSFSVFIVLLIPESSRSSVPRLVCCLMQRLNLECNCKEQSQEKDCMSRRVNCENLLLDGFSNENKCFTSV